MKDCKENDIDVRFIKIGDKDYPTIPMALVPFKENYDLIYLRIGDAKPVTVVPLFQVLNAISYPKADYVVIGGVKCCATCRKPAYPKSETVTEFADRCRECGTRVIPKSVLQDIKTEIEQDLSWFCFDDWGNESSTWTEIKKIIDKHIESADDK